MARPPKMVSSTSGQGVSRRSYQVGRSLGMRGSGAPAASGAMALRTPQSGSTATGVSSSRHYPKADPGSMNIGYSEREMANPDLKSLDLVGKMKPPKTTKGFPL
jgi:hypothetical protein